MTNLKNVLNYKCKSLSIYGTAKPVGIFWLLRVGDYLRGGAYTRRSYARGDRDRVMQGGRTVHGIFRYLDTLFCTNIWEN